ncbi:MAG: GNAT family N-acetyltransferase [Gammaproteobacteria bacterium]|nr:GNAT family N-acetyltransferase [Gammaproteobacteria bacterium]MBU1443832.1 GNAT family N-acetyltransferase [Gammaproteobacteria bacterium]MBU2288534.1 GNAT family N-acetyltransferase [Gammaproteobacteria bacterium]MBU2410347.1 GNAT family N-acetyltransferase [Gammaproteobacteria bacterium]
MTGRFRLVALAPDHDRAAFDCGSDPLDKYLREQASQDMRRRTSVCYVAIDEATNAIAGYYTLAASSVPLTDLSEAMAKKLPRYPLVPVARVGRLAVSVAFQKRQLGAALLWDAGLRAMQSGMGVFALVVDAKDKTAASFYKHHGFVSFSSNPLAYVLPIATLAKTK